MSSMLSLVHAEQLLFSCVILTFCGKTVENLFRYSVSQVIGVHCIVQLGSFLTECVSSKVTVTVMLSHVTFHCHMSNAYVDTWDMLNNFCFPVHAQKSLFIGQNGNALFDIIIYSWELAQWVQMLQTRWWWWWVM